MGRLQQQSIKPARDLGSAGHGCSGLFPCPCGGTQIMLGVESELTAGVPQEQEEGVFAGLSPLCAGSDRCSSFKVDFTLRAITRDPHNPRCTAQTQDL